MKIKKLKLFTSNLNDQERFYVDRIGFELVSKTANSISLRFGQTELNFEYKEQATPYHFAFNVPSNQIEEALIWLKQKVDIITHEGEEIQDFDSWNAKAVYFYDQDKNIVEFIAREDLNSRSNRPFSVDSILSVSEIAIASRDNVYIHDLLISQYGLAVFSGNIDVFTAIGDNEGLFICMDKTKRNWFPTGEKAFCSDFELEFMEKDKSFHLAYRNEKLIV